MRRLIAGAGMALILSGAGIGSAPVSIAGRIGNCQSDPWGFLGLTKERGICDGPILPDGSWMRHRVIGRPGYWVDPGSDCYSGYYSSHCSYHDGYWVPERDDADETYSVRPETVLPDEPGHLG
jgi:hypothetical protein